MTIWGSLLPATLLLPVAGAVAVSAAGQLRADRRALWCRATAVTAASLAFLTWAVLFAVSRDGIGDFASFDGGSLLWVEGHAIDVRFSLGLDGLGLPFVGATTLLTLGGLLADPGPRGRRGGGYYCLVLLLEAGLLGTFLARDVVLFHLAAEWTSICLFLLVGIWGNRHRRASALKLLIFGSCGGLAVLSGLLGMALWNYPLTGRITTSLVELTAGLAESPIPPGPQTVILILLLGGLAAKSGVFPLHGWLPGAIAEAPTAVRVILAGAAIELGGYGFVRFGRVLLPDAVAASSIWLPWLLVAGMIGGAIMAILQSDLRRLVGYVCVSQMGLCMLGLFWADNPAVGGGVIKLTVGGLAMGGLLCLLAVEHDRADLGRSESHRIDRRRRATLVTLVVLFSAASLGLPGTAGFIGMRSLLLNLQDQSWAIFVLTVLGIASSVCCTLTLAWRMLLPSEGSSERTPEGGPSNGQILAAGLLFAFIVWISLGPKFFTDRFPLTTNLNIVVDRSAIKTGTSLHARE